MTNKPMLSERDKFEAFWRKEMNIEAMDLHRCEFPMMAYEDQPYACHETERGRLTWMARARLENKLDPVAGHCTHPPGCKSCSWCGFKAEQPAPKQQEGAVAWLVQCKKSGLVEQAEPHEKASNPSAWSDAFPVYAEQPAPVADQTQCEECKGWGYHENHHEGGGTECGECGGSGNASLAVVMVIPDRVEVEPFTTIDRGSKNYKAGYNAALSEVARLNEVKP